MIAAAVAVLLIAGLLAELRKPAPPTTTGPPPLGQQQRAADGDADNRTALAGARAQADLPACPQGPGNGGPAALRGLAVECAADGAAVDAARVFAGQRVVVNLWAYWCVPCRAELPAMADYQRRVGPHTRVVTVHQDDNEAAALALLAQLGVRLPTLQDGRRRVAAGLRVPNVMPATVVVAPDGSVDRILPRAFADAEEIAAAVDDQGR